MKSNHLLNIFPLCSLGSAIAIPGSNAELLSVRSSGSTDAPTCPDTPITLSLNTPPNYNYLYSDCNVAAEVVVSNSRLLVAWPAGSSGAEASLATQDGGNVTVELVNSTVGSPLAPVYTAPAEGSDSQNPTVGVTGVLRFNSTGVLSHPILGSTKTIRDDAWDDSKISDSTNFTSHSDGSASVERLWLDNVTTTSLHFTPANSSTGQVSVDDETLVFDAGDYVFTAEMNYPQLSQMRPEDLLNSESQGLITESPDQVAALSFLSYSEKLLAGAWTYLTYFGRDSMISALLLEPILSSGKNSSMEAVIGAALERVNRSDGAVCHQESIGDYATWTNEEDLGISSNAMVCDYKMVDTDYYLPILMDRYFLRNPAGSDRASDFLKTPAGSANAANQNLTWGQLSVINAQRVMDLAGPFVDDQTDDNLIHLKDGEDVGQWRDSGNGIGGGRIPYDVNTALVPAALRSIAALARGGVYPQSDFAESADEYAQVWEDNTLEFFEVTISQDDAIDLVDSYTDDTDFPGSSQTDTIDEDIHFYALALDGNLGDSDLPQVTVMNSDDSFRLFFLNTTNQDQLTSFVNQTANNVRRTFPAGLMTDAGMLVANPAYGDDSEYAESFTTTDYHGTVIWSWQLAMMAKGLEFQLGRCTGSNSTSSDEDSTPEFCGNDAVFANVKNAYNILWDSIEANTDELAKELWAWEYEDDKFEAAPYATANIWQLWSLTFLAVSRNEAFQ